MESVEAAQAVLDRWDSPQWEWSKHGPTADLMHVLRAELAQPAAPDVQPVAWIDKHGNIDRGLDAILSPDGWVPLYAAAQAAQPAPSKPVQTFETWQQGFDAGYQQGLSAQPAPQPLSDSQIRTASRDAHISYCLKPNGVYEVEFARLIERAVLAAAGITAAPTTDKGQG